MAVTKTPTEWWWWPADEPLGATNRVMGYKKVTVMVTDEDEPGMVTLSAQKPQIGVSLTCYTGPMMTRLMPKSPLPSGCGSIPTLRMDRGLRSLLPRLRYTSPLGVVDKYLRVTATYDDGHGTDKSEMAVSAHIWSGRCLPPITRPLCSLMRTPWTTDTQIVRKVDENSPLGTNVGNPVVANDASGDTLTYTFGTGNDEARYSINAGHGADHGWAPDVAGLARP